MLEKPPTGTPTMSLWPFAGDYGAAASDPSLQCMDAIFCCSPNNAAAAENVIRAQKYRQDHSLGEEFFLEQEATTELILKVFDSAFPHFLPDILEDTKSPQHMELHSSVSPSTYWRPCC